MLTPEVEALAGLSAALATGSAEAVDRRLRQSLHAARPEAVEEVVLQAHLFVGFPAVLNAFVRWRELHEGPPGVVERGNADHGARGEAVCRVVYGSAYERLRGTVAALHPDLDLWMVEEGYGRVLGRPGVPLAVRELCIIALLVPQDAPRQLHSHLRGALHAGASTAEIRAVLDVAAAEAEASVASSDARARSSAVWRRVHERHRSRSDAESPPSSEGR
ncbi:MAG: carboxymuconolactone decarboxylase family protein [Gemmatimonadetes bacterium]|nr:carboxymuconolactone decarboxylase family protein [Gemmatimonadota bacterium]